ncbi:10112_t:CDS:2 [Funneliformis caledonium]|uniref:10112_t:CDS:1 n=1 Tax=Funneliformis caledonium TaxID=1117310 RepID=A0A9N9I3J0_9GLOM|nr:10112_t:CDS:2 [Funneliformis caledonium]
MERKLTEYQYVCQHLTDSTLVAKNFYSYFGYTSLSDGIDALQNILKSLRDDTKFRNIAEGYLKRDNFFRNDKIDFYFMRKERKMKEKRTTEKTLTMANERHDLATDIVHNNLLNSLNKVTNNLEENEDDNDEAKSSTPPVKVDNNSNTQANNLPCYLDQIPLHAEYSHMREDWKMDDINLSNNLKGIGIIKRGHFNFSDTDCTSQISDEHWDEVIIPFLSKHKLKNAFSTEDDEKTLINMFGEEKKRMLLKPGNLKLVYSLTDTEEDTTEVLKIVNRIRLVQYLKEFSDCQTLTSLEKQWPISLPSDILDKRLRDILWASELIKWVIVQWQDGTFLGEMKEQWVKTQLVSRLLVPIKPGEIESNAEKIVANYDKALMLPKIKAKTRVDGLDDAEEFENVWVELKGGLGNYHEAENRNNREDLEVLFKGFSTMSAMQALTMPEEAKKEIGDLEFFGIRGSGIQDLLYAIRIVYSFKIRIKTSKLKFHQVRALARSKRVFEADSSPIKAKRIRKLSDITSMK